MAEATRQPSLLDLLAQYAIDGNADYPPEHFTLCALALKAAGRAVTFAEHPESAEPLTEFEEEVLGLLRMLFDENDMRDIGTFYNLFEQSEPSKTSLLSQTLDIIRDDPPRTHDEYLAFVENSLEQIFEHSDNGYVQMSDLLRDAADNILEPPQFAWHSKTGTTLYVEDDTAPPLEPPQQPKCTKADSDAIVLSLESSDSLHVSVRGDDPQAQRHMRLSVKITRDSPGDDHDAGEFDWLISTGTDGGAQRMERQEFHNGTQITDIEQMVGQALVLSIECWRRGCGTDALTIAMGTKLSMTTQGWFLYWYLHNMGSDVVGSIMIVISAHASTLYAFAQSLSNWRRQVATRTVMFTQPALDSLWLFPDREMTLGQMAGYSIAVQRHYVQDPTHEARVRCMIKSPRGRWSSGPEGRLRAYEGMSVVKYNDNMYAVIADPRDNSLAIAKRNRTGWDSPYRIEGSSPASQVVVCVPSELLLCYRDPEGRIDLVSSSDLITWKHTKDIGDVLTPSVPALACDGKNLHLAYRTKENTLLWSIKRSGKSWTLFNAIPDAETICGPSLHWAHGRLYITYVSSNLHVRLREYDRETSTWSPPFIFSATQTTATPQMASFSDYLMIAVRSVHGQGTVQLIKWDLESSYEIEQLNGCQAIAQLAMSSIDGNLWITYSDMHS